MANKKQEYDLRRMARNVEKQAKKSYGEHMGFVLLVFPFGENPNSVADYISNVERTSMINTLKETISRLENREDIPASNGSTH